AQSQPPLMTAEPVTVPETPSWPTTTLGNAPPQGTQPQTVTQTQRSLPWRWIWSGVAALGLLVGVPAVWSGVVRRDASPIASEPTPVQTVSLVRALEGHTRPIRTMLLVNGDTLISGSEDKTIRIWNLQQGTTEQTLEGHTSVVLALALSTDQQTLYSAGSDQSIIFWDIASGQPQKTLRPAHESPINTLALSPDGKVLASGSADGVVKLWNAETGELIEQLRQEGPLVNTLLFNRNGESLIAGGAALDVWNLKTQEEMSFETNQDLINRLAISPDNQTVISADVDKTVRFWDLATGELIGTATEHSRSVNDVVVGSNSLTFVTASADGTLAVWDMDSKQPIERLQGFDSDVYRYIEGPSGQIVTTGGTDNTIKVWQPAP
ncbi:MAG: WD40 repeat domain-containing protein, partial [Cyanobacteria bacterium Co-bin13]|nr:WD40 repeat domain-containing protein [Cyanobacteria bacterium Co-bin13]